MEISERAYEEIREAFPKQRREATIGNVQALNAFLYILENGCKWRSLPERYGKWNSVYMKLRRWGRNGVLQRAFLLLQEKGIIEVSARVIMLDSTSIKAHPDAAGAQKNRDLSASAAPEAGRTQSFIWLPHLTGKP